MVGFYMIKVAKLKPPKLISTQKTFSSNKLNYSQLIIFYSILFAELFLLANFFRECVLTKSATSFASMRSSPLLHFIAPPLNVHRNLPE